VTCKDCGAELPQDARFCLSCGAPQDASPPAAAEERKVVSVLFCDVVGFTSPF
jgi:hypothetical protein